MDLNRIVADLRSEQDRIGRAIEALLEPTKRSARKPVAPKRRGSITPAGRRRLSAAMKARWAARKVKSPTASSKATTVIRTAPKKRGGLTAAGRKRLWEAMKKRWAEKRKAAAKR